MTVSPQFLKIVFPAFQQKSKPRVFPSDTFTAVYEARRVDLDDLRNVEGLPETVVSATAKVRDLTNDAWLELGGVGVDETACEVTPATGSVGARIAYTIPGSFLQEAGDYILYVTAVLPGDDVDQQITFNRKFSVLEFGR